MFICLFVTLFVGAAEPARFFSWFSSGQDQANSAPQSSNPELSSTPSTPNLLTPKTRSSPVDGNVENFPASDESALPINSLLVSYPPELHKGPAIPLDDTSATFVNPLLLESALYEDPSQTTSTSDTEIAPPPCDDSSHATFDEPTPTDEEPLSVSQENGGSFGMVPASMEDWVSPPAYTESNDSLTVTGEANTVESSTLSRSQDDETVKSNLAQDALIWGDLSSSTNHPEPSPTCETDRHGSPDQPDSAMHSVTPFADAPVPTMPLLIGDGAEETKGSDQGSNNTVSDDENESLSWDPLGVCGNPPTDIDEGQFAHPPSEEGPTVPLLNNQSSDITPPSGFTPAEQTAPAPTPAFGQLNNSNDGNRGPVLRVRATRVRGNLAGSVPGSRVAHNSSNDEGEVFDRGCSSILAIISELFG